MKTGIVYDPVYLKHETGRHPECKERLERIIEFFETKKKGKDYISIKPRRATQEEIALNHSTEYINFVKRVCEKGGGVLDPDTVVSSLSFEAASFAVGGVLEAVDRTMKGSASEIFCLVRPPGHHALHSCSMGFCLFNNVAIGARYALKRYALKKILIIDFDLHHGNGTQDSFYGDKEVLYFSVHQYPYYPGTGSASESGEGKGKGYTVNVPLPAGSGDQEYIAVFRDVLLPRATGFEPQLIIVSAGFDVYEQDPIGGMKVTFDGFKEIGKVVSEIASKTSGRVISCLEGGYNLDGLPWCVNAYLGAPGFK